MKASCPRGPKIISIWLRVCVSCCKLEGLGRECDCVCVIVYVQYAVLFIYKNLKDKDDFSCILLDAPWCPSAALQGVENKKEQIL